LCGYLEAIGREEDRAAALPDELLQRLWGAVIRTYMAKVQHRPDGAAPLSPFRRDAGVGATEAIVTALEVLKAVDVAVFELGMWQALGAY